MKPIIGITTSTVECCITMSGVSPSPAGASYFAVSTPYLRAIEAAGGIPIVLPHIEQGEDCHALLSLCSGIILTGGPDVHPTLYSRQPDEHSLLVNAATDHFEMRMLQAAEERDLPVLGICRGMQLMNVYRHGSLWSHLPDLGDQLHPLHQGIEHGGLHSVRTEPGSRVHSILGPITPANSTHHQAVHRLGKGLHISGRAEDGIVEVIEDPDKRFFLGVQWHPELLPKEGYQLIKQFVDISDYIRSCR